MVFEEKLKEIIFRAKRIKNVTKEVANLDQKVALGLKKEETNIENYSIVFEKNEVNNSYNKHEDDDNGALFRHFYSLAADPSMQKLEYIMITFSKIKRSFEKSMLLSNNSSEVVQINKAIKIPILTEALLTVEFESTKIYETENIDSILGIYKALILKERELSAENAERLRDKLMSL